MFRNLLLLNLEGPEEILVYFIQHKYRKRESLNKNVVSLIGTTSYLFYFYLFYNKVTFLKNKINK